MLSSGVSLNGSFLMADHRDGPITHERPPDFVWDVEARFTPVVDLDVPAPVFQGELEFNGQTWPAWAPPPVGDLLL